jgi:hypothetical protein
VISTKYIKTALNPFKNSGTYIYHLLTLKKKQVLEELIAYVPLISHGPHKKDASNDSSIVAHVFVSAVTFLQSRCLATAEGYTHGHTD